MVFSGCMGSVAPKADDPIVVPSDLRFEDPAGDAPKPTDVVAVHLNESATTLHIEMTLSSVPAAGLAALAAEGYRYVYWDVCWGPAGGSNAPLPRFDECAGLAVEFNRGVADARGYFETGLGLDAGCNNWAWCAWNLPYTFTPGTPATIRLDLPRAFIAAGEKGDQLNGTAARTFASREDPAVGDVAGGRGAYAYAYAAGRGQYLRVPATLPAIVDTTSGHDFKFALPRDNATTSAVGTTIFRDAKGDVGGGPQGYRSELDLTQGELVETKDAIQVKLATGSMEERPSHQFYMSLGLGDHVFEAWYDVTAGLVRDDGGGYCPDFDCHSYVEYPIAVSFQKGTPGSITITIQRSNMPDLAPGARVNLADFYLYEPSIGRGAGAPGGAAYLFVYATGPGDWAWGALDAAVKDEGAYGR